MNYEELRDNIFSVNKFKSGIRLDSSSVVSNPDKFVNTHITYLDHQRELKESGKRVSSRMVNLHFKRLLKFYKEHEAIQ